MLAFGLEILTDFIANNAVTNPKLADMAQGTIKGRAAGAGTGDPTDLSAAQVKAIITPILTADIGDDQVTYAKMQNISAASRLLGRGDSGAGDPEEIVLGTGLSMVGTTLSATGGTSIEASWNFDTSTTAADPGIKKFRLNNATLASVTEIFLDDETVAGFVIDTLAGFLDTGHRIYVQQKDDASRAALFLVTGPATDNGGWWTVPVSVLDSGTLFGNNEECAFLFSFSGTGVSDGDKGDITVSGGGSVWTIDNDAVTFAKIQNITTDRLLGRDTAGSGDTEEISVGGGIEFNGSAAIQTSAFTGDVTKAAGGTALTIANDAVTFAKMQNIATDRLMGRDTAGTGDPEEISVGGGVEFTGSAGIQTSAFTGDVTKAAGGTALTIANNAVTDAKLRDSAALSVIGRSANSTGDPGDIAAVAASDEVLRESGGTLAFGQISTNGILDNTVTFAKIQNIATDRLVGRDTAGTGDPEEISVGGGIEFNGSAAIQTSAFTGDVTKAAGGTALTIANDAVTFAKFQNISTDRLLGRDTAGTGDVEEIALGFDHEFSGSGSIQLKAFTGDLFKPAANIDVLVNGASGTFTLAGILTPPQITSDQNNYAPTDFDINSVLYLSSNASRNITGLVPTEAIGLAPTGHGRLVLIHNIGSNNIVLVDESGSSTASNRFALQGNLTLAPDACVILTYDNSAQRWRAVGVQSISITGDVTGSGITSIAVTIANDAVTNAKLADMATATFKGRTTAGTGDPEDLTATQATALLNNFVGDSGAGGTKGLVPAPAAGDAAANKFLKADGTWVAPAGSGDVVGPASATPDALALFNGSTGKLLKNSVTTLDSNGVMVTAATTAEWVGGAATTQFSTLGVALSPRIFSHSESALIPNMVMAKYVAAATAGANFNFLRSRGSEASKSIVSAGDTLGIISFLGHDGVDFAIAATIEGLVDSAETPASGDMGGRLLLRTSAIGTESPITRLSIDAAGSVEILNGIFTTPNTGLHVLESSGTDDLILSVTGTLTADRTLLFNMGDANRTLDMSSGFTGTGALVHATTPTLTSPVFAAGSASAGSWPKFTSGTVMTTAEAGAMEYDGKVLYFGNEASSRGLVPAMYVLRLDATNTLTNDTNPQPIFDQTGNGALTLPVGTYRFNMLISLSAMSGTSGNLSNFNLLGAGTATMAAVLYMIDGSDNAINANSANTQFTSNAASATGPHVSATNQTALQLRIMGTFEITGAGTIIPSCTLANAAAAVVAIGSFIEVWPLGSTSVQTIGPWS